MLEISGTKYFTLQEVAKSFAVSPQAVSRWRREGKLKGHQITERKFMFSETELEEFMKGEKE